MNPMSPRRQHGIVGVLLAAGKSSRFGSLKLLHPLSDGSRIGVRSALNLVDALPYCIAVIPPHQPLFKGQLEMAGLYVLEYTGSQRGLGNSLAHAVRNTPHAAGWVVALADMPFVTPATIREVGRSLAAGNALVMPTHNGRRGHPVGFSAHYFDELSALRGDVGARAIVERDASMAQFIAVPDPGVHIDIDTPEDLARRAHFVECWQYNLPRFIAGTPSGD